MEIVSVIIPTYNRTYELRRALLTVISQTYSNLEIIIVDDNVNQTISKEINDIVYSFNDSRIILIKPKMHVNGAYARNVGISISHGKYIAFLDDDDEWIINKVEIQINFLLNNPEYKGVSCNYSFFKNGNEFKTIIQPKIENMHLDIFRRSVSICTPTLLFDRDSLLDSGLFNENLKRHQDIQLLLDFTIKYKLYIVSDILVRINIDDKSNEPDNTNIEKIKNDFFDATSLHFSLYSKSLVHRIKAAHYFEIIYVMLRNKKYFRMIPYLFKIGLSLNSYIDLSKRMKLRSKKNG